MITTSVSFSHFQPRTYGNLFAAQSVHLYQQLTKALAKLSDGVESELQRKMDELNDLNDRTREAFDNLFELNELSRLAFDNLNDRTRQVFDNVFDNLGIVSRRAVDNLEMLSPEIDHLSDKLAGLSGGLEQIFRQSTDTARDSQQEVEGLRRLINLLLKQALEGNAELASVHEVSVRQASMMASDEFGALAAIVATAAASSASLQEQIVSNPCPWFSGTKLTLS